MVAVAIIGLIIVLAERARRSCYSTPMNSYGDRHASVNLKPAARKPAQPRVVRAGLWIIF
jgi:hypothetical protein